MGALKAIHPMDSGIAVRFDSVSFSYGEVQVLKHISFHIHCGEFVALVGPNGSGKTTVLKLLLGLERPVDGRIELFGVPREKAAGQDRIGYVPQQAPADHSFPISVRDVVRMGLLRPSRSYAPADRAAIDKAMEQAGIASLAERRWRALSGGERRRTLVARALASCPDLLILDEPTANMDSESEIRLFETLGRLNGKTTILIVTHDTDFVSSLTGRVLCLGDDKHNQYGMVQHRIEAAAAGEDGHHGGTGSHGARVLHGENIPADDCFG
jgi:zinc transport system ATP-binding protein